MVILRGKQRHFKVNSNYKVTVVNNQKEIAEIVGYIMWKKDLKNIRITGHNQGNRSRWRHWETNLISLSK